MSDSTISNLTAQTTLHDADLGVGVDTTDTTQSANGTTKNFTWTTIKSFLKTYFDTLYPTATLDTDGTLAANSDTKIASQKAVKTYADTKLSATNPTITKPTINGSVQGVQSYTPAGGATATLDLSLANRNLITMPAGNATIALSNATVGQIFTIDITQDGVGSRTVTWFTTIRWSGGSAPTLTTTASKRDSFIFVCTGSNTYDGYVIGFNL